MTGPEGLEIYDIVQIRPGCATNLMFGCCLLVVTEIRSWGVVGYVQGLGQDGKMGGLAFISLPWAEIDMTGGSAEWRATDEAKARV